MIKTLCKYTRSLYRLLSGITSVSLFEVYWYEDQQWVALLSVGWQEDECGHLFYVEHEPGTWKFDLLWLRPFYYRWWLGYYK